MDGHRTVALDGVRGIAALAVMAFHLGLLPIGWMGVQVFFVLSGYLITKSLIDRPGRPLLSFYGARASRLLPVMLVYLAANAALVLAVGGGLDGYGWILVGLGNYHIGLHGGAAPNGLVNHFWSLAVELQFYLLWPLVLIAFRRVWPLALVAMVVAPVARELILQSTGNPYLAVVSLPSCLDAFAAGALVAVAPRARYLALSAAVGVAVLLISMGGLSPADLLSPETWAPQHHMLLTGLALVAAPLISVAARLPVVGTPPLVWIGQRSYSLYVWHLLAIVGARSIGMPWAATALIALIASLVMADLSWRLIERPGMRSGQKLYAALQAAIPGRVRQA